MSTVEADVESNGGPVQQAGLPALGLGGFSITVFAGSLADVTSPARVFSPVTGGELAAATDAAGNPVSLGPGGYLQ